MIKELVLARIALPQSKRATVRELDHHGELSLNLDSAYRSMDRIDEALIQGICRRSREVTETLLPGPLTVVFYDTTTLYFESEQDDELRRKGYSKDGKPHRARRIGKLQARLSKNRGTASYSHRGATQFLDFPEGQVVLNEDKIARAARWDSLRGIIAWVATRPTRAS